MVGLDIFDVNESFGGFLSLFGGVGGVCLFCIVFVCSVSGFIRITLLTLCSMSGCSLLLRAA